MPLLTWDPSGTTTMIAIINSESSHVRIYDIPRDQKDAVEDYVRDLENSLERTPPTHDAVTHYLTECGFKPVAIGKDPNGFKFNAKALLMRPDGALMGGFNINLKSFGIDVIIQTLLWQVFQSVRETVAEDGARAMTPPVSVLKGLLRAAKVKDPDGAKLKRLQEKAKAWGEAGGAMLTEFADIIAE